MCQKQDGYRLVRANQLLAALAAFDAGEITFRALRVYLASFELLAIRETADRSRIGRGKRRARFRRAELSVRIGLAPEVSVGRELALLKRAGLLAFSEGAILVAENPPHGVHLHPLLGGRGATRLVPVPRRMLGFLARCSKPALVKTVIAYVLRGLSLDPSGELRGKGAAKISWICALCRISERAARSARAELIRLGWITKDAGSLQRKLNRDGAYFVIDTAWRRAATSFAPLRASSRTPFAPPLQKRETPSDLKDQKLSAPAETGSWRTGSKPNLRNVRPEDIRRPSRLRELFEQATRARWVQPTEAGWLNFVAAAVRANRVPGDAVRVFMGIVRQGLWHHISTADEERARAVLLSLRTRTDQRRKAGRPGGSGDVQAVSQTDQSGPSEIQGLVEKLLRQTAMPAVSSVPSE